MKMGAISQSKTTVKPLAEVNAEGCHILQWHLSPMALHLTRYAKATQTSADFQIDPYH